MSENLEDCSSYYTTCSGFLCVLLAVQNPYYATCSNNIGAKLVGVKDPRIQGRRYT